MNKERWIENLAEIARQEGHEDQQRFDARWDALAAGDLAAEQEAELAREAEQDPEMRLAYEAFRPLGPSFRDRIVEQIRHQLTATDVTSASVAWPSASSTAAAPRSESTRGRSWQPWALAAALLAALGLTLLLPSPPSALPEYGMIFEGMTRQERSSAPTATHGPLEFDPGNLFSLVLQPATSLEGPVEASFFLAGEGDEMALWTPSVERAPTGAFKVAGLLGQDLELPPGDWLLVVVIARPPRLPDIAAVRQLLAGQEPAAGWIVLRQTLRMRGG